MIEWTPEQLRHRLTEQGPAPLILDVREPWEYALAHLPGARLVPMGEIAAQVDTLPRDREIVVVCHHGIRSRIVAAWLEKQGFGKVINLTGGLDAWSLRVDPALPRY